MLNHIQLDRVLFLDIETVPLYPDYGAMPDLWQELWNTRARNLVKEHQLPSDIYERAGIYAEFGKIVCISVGFFNRQGNEWQFRLKSFYGDDEATVLQEFASMVNRFFHDYTLCAHNGKEFDFPYLCRRMLIHGIELPNVLDIAGKKPWEVNHLDTMDLWKFGDFKSYTSLNLLAAVFGIPSSKDDIDGSQVGWVYWQDRNLPRIKTYCQKDVVLVAQLLLRFKNMPLLEAHQVVNAE